jgi:hypothetical protein
MSVFKVIRDRVEPAASRSILLRRNRDEHDD